MVNIKGLHNLFRYFTPYKFRFDSVYLPDVANDYNSILFKLQIIQVEFDEPPTSFIYNVIESKDPVFMLLDKLKINTSPTININKIDNETYEVSHSVDTPTCIMLRVRDMFSDSKIPTYQILNGERITDPLRDPFKYDSQSEVNEFHKLIKSKFDDYEYYDLLVPLFHSYIKPFYFSVTDKNFFTPHGSILYYANMDGNKAVEFIKTFGKTRHSLCGYIDVLFACEGGFTLNSMCPLADFCVSNNVGKYKLNYGDVRGTQSYCTQNNVPFWIMMSLKESIDAFGVNTRINVLS